MATPLKLTRSSTAVWLVGHPIASIDGPAQLPTCGVALRRLLYEMKTNNSSLPISCSTVADELMSLWVRASITTTAKPHVVTKLKVMHQDHVKVSKNKARRSATQIGLEAAFTSKMNKLFNIAHADWERLTIIHEDRQFLIDQRGPRQ